MAAAGMAWGSWLWPRPEIMPVGKGVRGTSHRSSDGRRLRRTLPQNFLLKKLSS